LNIDKPTYFIAELAGDVVELVRSMRNRYNPDNVFWPADITIAGSSGVGTLRYDQSMDQVIEALIPVVTKLKFSKVDFIGIERFPDTGIYYLKPERSKFDQMHRAAISSEIKFNDNPYPYNPHCTLRWKNENTPETEKFFNSVVIPKDTVVECFSLYQPEVRGGNRAYTF